MKIIFDNVDDLISFIKLNCPGEVHPNLVVDECPTGYDYDPATCEKCWTERCELEVKCND